ncbi:MAG: hypothetical protein F7B20_01975 [Aeropyrum sp.]|nr:hypothetical protein [Aeropyrum sp.]MCE4615886.1 hypothetical protein [Aeropyrum sp.]
MGLISFKPLAAVFVALTVVSALGGIAVYYMHYNTLKAMAFTPTLGDILDDIDYLEYTVKIGGDEYRVVVDNNPSSRSGTAELYLNGELQYTIEYEYIENALKTLSRVDPNTGEKSPLDVLRWEEAFLTGLVFSQGPEGEIIGVDVFPGIAPLYAPFYISGSLNIDWEALITTGTSPGSVRVTINFESVETPLGTKRGISVLITPQFVGVSQNPWAQGPLVMEIARVDGHVVAQLIRYEAFIPGVGEGGIEVSLEELRLA